MGKNRIRREKLIAALEQTRGNVIAACKLTGYSNDVFYDRLGLDLINEIRDKAHEWRLDMAELHLDKKLIEGDERAVYHVLNRLGRRRGWEPGAVQVENHTHVSVPTAPSNYDWRTVFDELQKFVQNDDTENDESS